MKKVFGVFCIGGILLSIFFCWKQNGKQENEKNPYIEKGYSIEVVQKIEKLSAQNQSYLLEEDYIDYLNVYFDHSDFVEENLKDYVHFNDLYRLSLTDTIYIVNHAYDDKNQYDEKTVGLMHEEYYIHDYLERYLNYTQKEDYKDIVTDVNSNLDYAFYTVDYAVDLEKQYLILVNKYYKLASDYVPENLVTIASPYGIALSLESTVYEQYKRMWEAANQEGLHLYICSPYRSYSTQNGLYNRYVASNGKKAADTYSARPGYSEHQTGLAFDVITPTTNLNTFEASKEFAWLQEHAHEYGFILRYPKGKEYITGYIYEPWHYRYVGVEVATKIKETGLTYEEYYAYYVR